MKSGLLRLTSVCILFGFIVPLMAQSQAGAAVQLNDAPVELPPFTVSEARDLPPPENWRYAEIDGLEILSNATAGTTNRVLQDFLKFRQALQIVRPVSLDKVAQSSLILCGAGGRFADFIPAGGANTMETAGLFLRDREQNAIVINLEAKTANTGTAPGVQVEGFGYIQATVEVDSNRQLQREYVRFLLIQSGRSPPAWLIEGYAQIVMDIEYTDRWIVFGRIDAQRGALVQAITGRDEEEFGPEFEVGDRPFNVVLQRRALLPLDKFFAIGADDPVARNTLGDNLWAKQAYAFVHLCLFGADGRFERPLALFLQRLATEPPSERLFEECFNLSYREMLRELRGYIDFTRHKYRTHLLEGDQRLVSQDIAMRAATQGEVGRIKGDVQQLAGRNIESLLNHRAAYARGERDPRLLGALGIGEQGAGRPDRARALLEAATARGTPRPSAYVALARLRLDEAKAQPAADGRLSGVQQAAVLYPLFQVRNHPPLIEETYELMAEAWMLGTLRPELNHVRPIGEGAKLFPDNNALALQAAQLYLQAGDRENAADLARFGLGLATETAMRVRFEEFLATLESP